jgi:hypothetical protein
MLSAPSYNCRSGTLAKLGLQKFRIRYHSDWRHHPRHPGKGQIPDPRFEDALEALDRDGVVSIPDFLSPEIWARLQEELSRARSSMKSFRSGGLTEIQETIDTPAFTEDFANHALLLAMAEAVTHRKVSRPPTPFVWILQLENEQSEDATAARTLHADTHYPTMKVFFCLNDIDEENAAFTFVPGSHRLTPERIDYEYERSVEMAHRNDGTDFDASPYAVRWGLQEIPMCGKANTCIIANTQGFHRRGTFHSMKPREYAHLDFRYLEGLRTRLRNLVP